MSKTFIPLFTQNFSRLLARNFYSTLHRYSALHSNPPNAKSDTLHKLQLRCIFGKSKNSSEDKANTEEKKGSEQNVNAIENERVDSRIVELKGILVKKESEMKEVIAKKEEELKEANKKYLYALAEMENTRKIMRQQIQDSKLFAIQNFTKDLLSIADTLESAVKSVKPADFEEGGKSFKNLFDGVKMTESNLQKTLSNHGLERLEPPLGDKFDPTYHESAFLMPGEVPGTIGEMRSVGYLLNGRLLRPSLVGVIQEKRE